MQREILFKAKSTDTGKWGGGAAELLQYGRIRYKDGKLLSWII